VSAGLTGYRLTALDANAGDYAAAKGTLTLFWGFSEPNLGGRLYVWHHWHVEAPAYLSWWLAILVIDIYDWHDCI